METTAERPGMFEDPEFPADDRSIFRDYTTPLPKVLGDVIWLRPQDICTNPQLFPDNPVEAHPKQGILGDCWLLSACSLLLKNQHLLSKVVPPEQPVWGDGDYRGDFLFRFWLSGHWTDVRVDDRLPCVDGSPCFSRCRSPTAFWVALMEKAYAKLRGSYERLWAGRVCDAVVDLSGTVAERWTLTLPGHTDKSKNLSPLSLELKDECVVSCCVHSATTGVPELGQFHAMSVMEWISVTKTSGEQVQLIRIQNPWGRRSWSGAWTESGAGWSSLDPGCVQALMDRTSEGEFWMDETEFQQEFDEITVACPVSATGALRSIYTGSVLPHSHQIGGCWVKGQSAGGCRNNGSFSTNPKYWLKVCEKGEVLLSLLQVPPSEPPAGGSTGPHPHLQAIALHMWKVERKHFRLNRTLNKPPLVSHPHVYDREVVTDAHLCPGFYLLVPSTFLPGAEGRFLLRVHSSCPSSLSLMKSSPAVKLSLEGEWETISSHGGWTLGSTAGGGRNFSTHGRNPQIPLTVTYDPGGNNIQAVLRQQRPENDLHAIGFHIYKVPEGGSISRLSPCEAHPVLSCVPHAHSQEVGVSCRLRPGEYVVVPSTYQPDLSAHFTLTLTRRIHRKAVRHQEHLDRAIQEVSCVSVMRR